MNRKKVLLYIIIAIAMASVVIAADPTKEADWKGLFGSLGSIGFYFQTIVNWLQYTGLIIFYIISVLAFFLFIGLLIFWLPLKMYPTLIQYNNFFKRIFRLN